MGAAAPGVASGTALKRMEELAHQVLPHGIGFEWTELAFQQHQQGTPTLLVFGAAALLVFLVLTAQYESWKLPLAAANGRQACSGLRWWCSKDVCSRNV